MKVETIRLSSKGQLVIPQAFRKEVDASEGTIFAAVCSNDTIVLKKMSLPSKEKLLSDLDLIARDGRRRIEALGFNEKDIPLIVEKRRRSAVRATGA